MPYNAIQHNAIPHYAFMPEQGLRALPKTGTGTKTNKNTKRNYGTDFDLSAKSPYDTHANSEGNTKLMRPVRVLAPRAAQEQMQAPDE